MKILKLLLLGIIWLASNELSFGQKNWVIEAKVGTGNTDINTTGNFPDLTLTTNSHTFISFGVLKKLKNNFSIGLEIDIYRFNLRFTFLPLEADNGGGINNRFWSIGPKIQKDIYLLPKLGLSLSAGFHLAQTHPLEKTYDGIWQSVLLPGGGQPIPVLLYGNEDIQQFTFHIKPEGGIFYDLTESSRITFSCEWGINVSQPALVVNLDRIVFEDQTFQNRYIFNDNYYAAQLGYRYSF
jgi:hypothetical protein